jgi:hypothetical protein
VHPSWTPATFEFGFLFRLPLAKEKSKGIVVKATVAAAAPMNLRLEIVEFFIFNNFWIFLKSIF